MSKTNSPMLAAPVAKLADLRYPLFGSFKLDGIRCWINGEGKALARSLKPIRNDHIRTMLEASCPRFLDGELAIVAPDGTVDFRATTSAVMRKSGKPDFVYFVFDHWQGPLDSFRTRNGRLNKLELPPFCVILKQYLLETPAQVEQLFIDARKVEHEGLILRCPERAYKFGRSTLREQGMLKMKPWADAEATVTSYTEEMENQNEKTYDERGYAERSSHQANKIGKGRLGTLVVSSSKWPKSFEIGTGFTAEDRWKLWQERDKLVGRLARFRYIDAGGYDVPRHASFAGWRHKEDLS
jgi:DNA ligase-1